MIVPGCDSATETVRDAVGSSDCKVIQGMAVAGVTNARLTFHLPGTVSFQGGRTVPLSTEMKAEGPSH